MSNNTAKRKSLKDSIIGLFKKEKETKEPEVEISGPSGFTRQVHVGIKNGEMEGYDKMLEAVQQLSKLDTATWDKIQKLKKTTKKDEDSSSPGTTIPGQKKEEENTEQKRSSQSDTVQEKKEENSPEKQEEEKKEVEKPKIICQYKSEEERQQKNQLLLSGNPLKSSLTYAEAKKKGFIVELDCNFDDENDVELQLFYYTATKTFLIEPTFKKQPIHKEYFVITLEDLVLNKKEGVKNLGVEFEGKLFLSIDCPIACVILRDSFIAMRKKN